MPDSVFGMVKNSTFVRFSKALAHLANGLGMPMRPDGSSATAAAPVRATPGRYPRYLEERRRLPDGTPPGSATSTTTATWPWSRSRDIHWPPGRASAWRAT
jgi:hypothetical protein